MWASSYLLYRYASLVGSKLLSHFYVLSPIMHYRRTAMDLVLLHYSLAVDDFYFGEKDPREIYCADAHI